MDRLDQSDLRAGNTDSHIKGVQDMEAIKDKIQG